MFAFLISFSQVLSYRQEIYMSQPVQLALELVASFQSNNYVQFFRILKKPATYLQVFKIFFLFKINYLFLVKNFYIF